MTKDTKLFVDDNFVTVLSKQIYFAIVNVFVSFEPRLKVLKLEKLIKDEVIDIETGLSNLRTGIFNKISKLPHINIYDVTACHRFNYEILKADKATILSIVCNKFQDSECEINYIFSLIFTFSENNLFSFKYELSIKEEEKDQQLIFRLITNKQKEISLEFNEVKPDILIHAENAMIALSETEGFEFSDITRFACGGIMTYAKELSSKHAY